MKYDKPPLSIDDQIQRLKDRGLVVSDEERAKRYLTHIGYYRLSAYILPYEEQSSNNERTHKIQSDVSFDDIVDLYVFDRKLRVLVLEAIERIEVSVRSNWTHYLSIDSNSSHAFLCKKYFNNHWDYLEQLSKAAKDVKQSNEIFVKHYLNKYTDPYLPHIWAISETLSIGALSRWYKNTKCKNIKSKVAKAVGIPSAELMDGILHCLTLLRNICAHHNRLWNRKMVTQLPHFKKLELTMLYDLIDDAGQDKQQKQLKRELYNYLIITGYMIKNISPKSSWLNRVKDLMNSRSLEQQQAMGFPPQWQQQSFWS